MGHQRPIEEKSQSVSARIIEYVNSHAMRLYFVTFFQAVRSGILQQIGFVRIVFFQRHLFPLSLLVFWVLRTVGHFVLAHILRYIMQRFQTYQIMYTRFFLRTGYGYCR